MIGIWTTWRRESREHPTVGVLTLVALLGFAAGPVLITAGMSLLGQFVAGLAVAPLALTVYLCALAGPWHDEHGDDGRGPGRDDGPPSPPDPQGALDPGVDWERFERELWAHVDEQLLVG